MVQYRGRRPRPWPLALTVLLVLLAPHTLADPALAARSAKRAPVRPGVLAKNKKPAAPARSKRLLKPAKTSDRQLWAALTGTRRPPAPQLFPAFPKAPAEAPDGLLGSIREEIPLQGELPLPPVSGTVSFIWPADGPVNSPFGPRRGRLHAGIDIGAPRHDPVRAAADGLVLYARRSAGGMGNTIVLQHDESLLTVYAHLTKVQVAEGQVLRQGEVIGTVGSTGRTTGPHLHFAVRAAGRPADPEAFLPPPDESLFPPRSQYAFAR